VEQDDRDRAELERQKSVAQDELQVLESARRARSRYVADVPSGTEHRFADERG